MRWRGMRKSDNVEDRRGIGGRQLAVGGGLGGIIIAVLFLLLGGNSDEVLQSLQTGGPGTPAETGQPISEADKTMGDFVSVVLAETEDVWSAVFQQSGRQYREPKLVLFTGQTRVGLRLRQRGLRPVLLPRGREGLPRPRFLRGHAERAGRSGRFRPGLRHRPRGRPPRPEPARHHGPGHGPAQPVERAGVQPAHGPPGAAGRFPGRRLGPSRPTGHRTSSSRATSRRGSTPRPRSATTGSRSNRRATSSRTRSPTAPRSSASAGSPRDSRRETSARATLSKPGCYSRPGAPVETANSIRSHARQAKTRPIATYFQRDRLTYTQRFRPRLISPNSSKLENPAAANADVQRRGVQVEQ